MILAREAVVDENEKVSGRWENGKCRYKKLKEGEERVKEVAGKEDEGTRWFFLPLGWERFMQGVNILKA